VANPKHIILQTIAKSICEFQPVLLKPYIMSDALQCDADKKLFYEFFRHMVCTSEANSIGELTLRIEDPLDGYEGQRFCFYDEVHIHPRLNIIVVEIEDRLFMDVLPF